MERKRGKNDKQVFKLQRIENDETQSYFELILEGPGFHFIFEEIFSNLNSTDLAKCHRVSKRFHSLLNKSKQWWISQLKFIRITPKTFTYWKWDKERKFKKQEVIDETYMRASNKGNWDCAFLFHFTFVNSNASLTMKQQVHDPLILLYRKHFCQIDFSSERQG